MDEAGRDDRTLRRIIATLVALAGLAERAAYRCLPVRWLVLCLLRHAECAVRDHVAETTGWDWSDLDVAFGIDAGDLGPGFVTSHGAGFDAGQGAGNGFADARDLTGDGAGPADALALAWRLRMLAAVLGSLLNSARHPHDRTIDLHSRIAVPEATPRSLAPRADSVFVILNGRRPAFRDTS